MNSDITPQQILLYASHGSRDQCLFVQDQMNHLLSLAQTGKWLFLHGELNLISKLATLQMKKKERLKNLVLISQQFLLV